MQRSRFARGAEDGGTYRGGDREWLAEFGLLEGLAVFADAARGDENLVPVCLEAVRLHATHGELCAALRDVFGEYHPDSLTQGV